MTTKYRFAERFVYIQQKNANLGELVLYRECRGLGNEAEIDATAIAEEIIARGERCLISEKYLGGSFKVS